jgi:hypothetical protein
LEDIGVERDGGGRDRRSRNCGKGLLISPEQILELYSLCLRHLSESTTDDVSLATCWSTGDGLHDGELLKEMREEGDDEKGARLSEEWR